MNTKKMPFFKKAVSILFIVVLVAQGILFVRQPSADSVADENRNVWKFPHTIKLSTHGIRDYFSAIDKYFSDRMFLRKNVIDFIAQLPNNKVFEFDQGVIGKEGWLFAGNAINWGYPLEKMVGRVTKKVRKQSDGHALWLDHTIKEKKLQKIFILVGVDKHTIYPEYLPNFLKPTPERYIQKYLDQLVSLGDHVFDPYEVIKSHKKDDILYYKTDSHWNIKGAAIVYEAFIKYLKPFFPDLVVPSYELIQEGTKKGDLINMLKLDKFPVPNDDTFKIVSINGGKGDYVKINTDGSREKIPFDYRHGTWACPTHITVINEHSLSPLRCWLFGDSFSYSMSPFFYATFRETVHYGYSEFYSIDFNVENKPDIIVFERVERGF